MAKAIRIADVGGPDVMEWTDIAVGAPGPGEARIEQAACGLNYIDVYHRNGLYPRPLPGGLGVEGAGTVVEVGEGVHHLRPGDRVAYAGGPIGAYADTRLIPADRLLKLPDGIDFETAAAMMLQGLTAQYLLRRTFRVEPGQTILFHAAAGGVGLFVCQWARALGAEVIGTVGSDEKAAVARAHGCSHTINYRTENYVERVRELTGGRGVAVVYDGVGRDTFIGSLDCLAPLGMMVSFGNASGPVAPFSLGELASRGSLYVTRPSLMDYTARRDDLEAMAADLFAVVTGGKVRVDVRQRYPLADAAQAHRDLEARRTTGSTILLP